MAEDQTTFAVSPDVSPTKRVSSNASPGGSGSGKKLKATPMKSPYKSPLKSLLWKRKVTPTRVSQSSKGSSSPRNEGFRETPTSRFVETNSGTPCSRVVRDDIRNETLEEGTINSVPLVHGEGQSDGQGCRSGDDNDVDVEVGHVGNDAEVEAGMGADDVDDQAGVGGNDGDVEDENEGIVEAPCVGMMFTSWEELEVYYKKYGKQKGFGVSRVQGVNSKEKKRCAMTWRCECWGDPDMRAIRQSRKRAREMEIGGSTVVDEGTKKGRKSKKCHCTSMVYARVNENDTWVIKKVILEHKNHDPIPSESIMVKEYRMQSFHSNARRRLMNDREAGVPISKIHDCMVNERDGIDNMPFFEKDMRHVVDEERKLKMEGGDANALMEYFRRMRKENLDFYYSHRMDETTKLKDVLWVDGRSRVAYEEFGDVVCFDTTYLTNEYELPFANFVGVNHHGQCTLLGCALISKEDCDTFRWIFSEWLLCMKGKAPDAILTDQAAAMRRPLEEIMPDTRHRWCIWHIMSKVPKRFGALERYDEFKEAFFRCVYNSLAVAEFEKCWAEVMEEFDLETDDWLSTLFNERYMWVPACMKGHFWAGMRTTQRVESMNGFFDKFIFRNTKLCEFGDRYCSAVRRRVAQEMAADARDVKWIRKVSTNFYVERVFRKVYTDAKFRLVQRECERLLYVVVKEDKDAGPNKICHIVQDRVYILPEGCKEEIVIDRKRMYCVVFDTESREAVCDCNMFESQGILCRHQIRVFDENGVKPIPEKYIIRRWRKDVIRKHSKISVGAIDDVKRKRIKRRDRMCKAYDPVMEAADVHDKTTGIVVRGLRKIREEVDEWVKQNPDAIREADNNLEKELGSDYVGDGVPENMTPKSGSTSKVGGNQGGGEEVESAIDGNGVTQVAGATTCGLQSTEGVEVVDTQGSGKVTANITLSTTMNQPGKVFLKDPDLPKRGRGRPKSTRFKAVGEPGWKQDNQCKSKTKGKGGKGVVANENKTTSKRKKGTASTTNEDVAGKEKGKKGKTKRNASEREADHSGLQGKKNTEDSGRSSDPKGKGLTKLQVQRRNKALLIAANLDERPSFCETEDLLLSRNCVSFDGLE